MIVLTSTVALLVIWAGGIFPVPLYLAAALLAAGVTATALTGAARARAQRPVLQLLGAALVLWIGLTALPLPDSVLRRTEFKRCEVQDHARVAAAQAVAARLSPPSPAAFSLSLNRAGTLRFTVLLIAMLSAAWLTASMPTRYGEHYLRFLCIVAVVIACGGLAGRWLIDTAGRLWWTFETVAGRAVACFVNPNHYGAFLAMTAPAIVAFAVRDIRRHEWERLSLWCLALGIVTAGVVASESRGAYLILAVSFLCTGLLSLNRSNARAGIGVAAVACLGFLALATLTTGDMDREIRNLAQSGMGLRGRCALWKDAARVLADFPVFGLGADGFRTISPLYATRPMGTAICHHAENTWLQIALDSGLAGVLLTLALACAYWRAAARCLRSRRMSSTVVIGALGAILVMLVHCSYDVPFDVPVYAVVAASYFGLLLGPGNRESVGIQPNARSRLSLLPAALGGLGLAVVSRIWVAYGSDIGVRDRYAFAEHAATPDLVRNLQWAPSYWPNWYWLGRAACGARTESGLRLGEACIARAGALAPMNPELQQTLTSLRQQLARREPSP